MNQEPKQRSSLLFFSLLFLLIPLITCSLGHTQCVSDANTSLKRSSLNTRVTQTRNMLQNKLRTYVMSAHVTALQTYARSNANVSSLSQKERGSFLPSNGARLIDMRIALLCTLQQPTLLLRFVATTSSDTCRRSGGDGRAGQLFPVVPFGTSEGLPSTHPANMAAVAKIKCVPSVFRLSYMDNARKTKEVKSRDKTLSSYARCG